MTLRLLPPLEPAEADLPPDPAARGVSPALALVAPEKPAELVREPFWFGVRLRPPGVE